MMESDKKKLIFLSLFVFATIVTKLLIKFIKITALAAIFSYIKNKLE